MASVVQVMTRVRNKNRMPAIDQRSNVERTLARVGEPRGEKRKSYITSRSKDQERTRGGDAQPTYRAPRAPNAPPATAAVTAIAWDAPAPSAIAPAKTAPRTTQIA